MSDFLPWQKHEDYKEAVRIRELSLPPQYRMPGNMRYLRDALLSIFLLSDLNRLAGNHSPEKMIQLQCDKGNLRTEMEGRAYRLKAFMTPEQIDKATEAAKDLFAWEMHKARIIACTQKDKPEGSRKKPRKRRH